MTNAKEAPTKWVVLPVSDEVSERARAAKPASSKLGSYIGELINEALDARALAAKPARTSKP